MSHAHQKGPYCIAKVSTQADLGQKSKLFFVVNFLHVKGHGTLWFNMLTENRLSRSQTDDVAHTISECACL